MTSSVQGAAFLCFATLLFFGHCGSSFLVIPDEFPSILHLIYSKIPPIRKGMDSRLGVGFRLGEHADFQILFELGPQQRTNPIGNNIGNNIDTKRRRALMMNTQSKPMNPLEIYSTEFENKSANLDSFKEIVEKDQLGTEWLSKWRQGLIKESQDSILPAEMHIKTLLRQENRMHVMKSTNNIKDEYDNKDLIVLRALYENSST